MLYEVITPRQGAGQHGRQQDAAKHLPGPHAKAVGRLQLTLGHRIHGAPDHLGGIGALDEGDDQHPCHQAVDGQLAQPQPGQQAVQRSYNFV